MGTTQPVGKVYVSGRGLSDIRILDFETLDEVDRIPTETNQNYGLVISDYLEEEEMNLVAFSDYDSSTYQSHVYIHNSFTNERLSQIRVRGIWGLEILSSFSSSSTPIIVSAKENRLCAYNSLTTEKLVDCQNLPFNYIKRIKCFPEWNLNEVFIGGRGVINGLLHRFDLNQDCVMLGSYVGHSGSDYSYLNGIAASLTDGILISGSDDDNEKGTLKLWSKDTFECIDSVNLDKGCYSLEYSSDSHLICCGTRNEIEIFDIRNMRNRLRKVLDVGNRGNGNVCDLDSISNSPFFVSGTRGGFVSIWNPLTGKVLRKTKVGGEIYGIRFLPSLNIQQLERRRIEQEREEEQRAEERIRQQQREERIRQQQREEREEEERIRQQREEEAERERIRLGLAQERQQEEEERRRRAERMAEEERIRQQELLQERERNQREEERQRVEKANKQQLRAAQRQAALEREERVRIQREAEEERERMRIDTAEARLALERAKAEANRLAQKNAALLLQLRETSMEHSKQLIDEREESQRQLQETERRLGAENQSLKNELTAAKKETRRLRTTQRVALQAENATSDLEELQRQLRLERQEKERLQREAEETERGMREEISLVRQQLKSRNEDYLGLENELRLSKEECTRIEARFESEKTRLQSESRILQVNNEELSHRIIALTERLGIEEERQEKPFTVRIVAPPDSIIVRGDNVKFGIASVDDSTRIESVHFGSVPLLEEDGEEENGSILEVECSTRRLRPQSYALSVNGIEIEEFDVLSGTATTYYAVVHESLSLEALSCLVRCEVRRGGALRRFSSFFGLADDAEDEIEPLRTAIEEFAGVVVDECELVRNRWIEIMLRPKKARKIQRQGRFFMVQGVEREHVVTLERVPPKHFVLQTDVVETPGNEGVISRVGASGIVRHGVLDIGPTSFEVAIKKQWLEFDDKYPGSLLDAEREVIMMCECDHPNVLRCRGCYVVPDDRGVTLFILSDYCSDGTVLHWLRRKQRNGTLHNADKISCLEQTAAGMLYLHTKGLIHRDLKPDNALMKNGQVKICDLGFTRHQNSLISQVVKGTPEYMSREVKEVTLETPIPNDEMFLVDVFAFGVCMWSIWNLKEPYGELKMEIVRQGGDVHLGLLNLIHPPVGSVRESIRPSVDQCDGMPEPLVELMVRCWDDDVRIRPEFGEIVRVLGESY